MYTRPYHTHKRPKPGINENAHHKAHFLVKTESDGDGDHMRKKEKKP